ncbi:MAG TPA: transporter substrate-binding domain-containing protein [Actinoplanes sp.]|nr:transporter substrate-binding domain-containing protein [Actinoplanes sp.]
MADEHPADVTVDPVIPPPVPPDAEHAVRADAVSGVVEPVQSRRSAMAMRLVAVAVGLVLTMVVGFAVVAFSGPPTVEDLRREAKLDSKQQLLIGVKDDQPGVSEHLPGGRWAGFDIDIAHLIAEDLGFRPAEVKFVAIESEDRARMQATDSDGSRVGVDLVIASYSITPAREAVAGVTFSAPYLFTEQSVVTRSGHEPVSSLEDLRGEKVCSLATATSENAVVKARAKLVSRKKISECFAALDAEKVDAVSTDAAILAGYKNRSPDKYAHYDIGLEGTEAWGVNVGENEALRKLVDLALWRSREDPADHRWEDAYDDNLRVEIEANLPAPIAVAAQPEVKQPQVRQWPWERVGR